jgi:hypothetical protein
MHKKTNCWIRKLVVQFVFCPRSIIHFRLSVLKGASFEPHFNHSLRDSAVAISGLFYHVYHYNDVDPIYRNID